MKCIKILYIAFLLIAAIQTSAQVSAVKDLLIVSDIKIGMLESEVESSLRAKYKNGVFKDQHNDSTLIITVRDRTSDWGFFTTKQYYIRRDTCIKLVVRIESSRISDGDVVRYLKGQFFYNGKDSTNVNPAGSSHDVRDITVTHNFESPVYNIAFVSRTLRGSKDVQNTRGIVVQRSRLQ